MPTEQETKNIRVAEITAALCLLLVVGAWFITSLDFASLVALVTALGAVIALYRRRIPGKEDILLISILVIVTGIGLYLIFGTDGCVNYKQGVITCEISDQRAAQLIYGRDVVITENGITDNGDDAGVHVIMARPYQELEVNKFVIFTQRLDPSSECPGCAPFIDGALFTQIDDVWYLDVQQLGIAQAGFMDVSPETDLVEIGPGKYGYLYFYPGESEGLNYKDALLITQIGEGFGVVFNDLVSLDNFQDCEPGTKNECWGYSSTINFIQGENPGIFDLLMSLDGTIALEDGSVVAISETKTYRFSHGENQYLELP